MRTRSALLALFVLLVGVPVAAAAYLGIVGLAQERSALVERERDAIEERAAEIRDLLVRRLQELYRAEVAGHRTGFTSDRFRIDAERNVHMEGPGEPPEDVIEFARSAIALGSSRSRTSASTSTATSRCVATAAGSWGSAFRPSS